MPAKRTRRRLTSSAASSLVLFGLFGGIAVAMAADRGPLFLEAYSGVNGFDPRALNQTEMADHVAEAVASYLADAPATEQAATEREQVNVILTLAVWDAAKGEVQAAGFAPVVEPDGQCTLRLTSPTGAVVESRGAAAPDVSTTSCATLRIPAAELTPGTWQAVLAYESPMFIGASQPLDVVIP